MYLSAASRATKFISSWCIVTLQETSESMGCQIFPVSLWEESQKDRKQWQQSKQSSRWQFWKRNKSNHYQRWWKEIEQERKFRNWYRKKRWKSSRPRGKVPKKPWKTRMNTRKNDVIGNKVDIMAGVIIIVNDCNNNGYNIFLKQGVALENVF